MRDVVSRLTRLVGFASAEGFEEYTFLNTKYQPILMVNILNICSERPKLRHYQLPSECFRDKHSALLDDSAKIFVIPRTFMSPLDLP